MMDLRDVHGTINIPLKIFTPSLNTVIVFWLPGSTHVLKLFSEPKFSYVHVLVQI